MSYYFFEIPMVSARSFLAFYASVRSPRSGQEIVIVCLFPRFFSAIFGRIIYVTLFVTAYDSGATWQCQFDMS